MPILKATYAHKKRRVQNAPFSSPLELLPPDKDDLTHTQMARRMLKRSRRVAQADDDDSLRENLAKRIKTVFQTPCHPSQLVHDQNPLIPEQLSPVPVSKRILSRTSSKSLKENSTVLASPFHSRPGSATSSPKLKSRKSKSHARRVSRKDSTKSLKDTNEERPARHVKHRRYPSNPSTAYMRSQESVIAPPNVPSRPFGGRMSPGGSLQSDASFYADKPQSYSTPAHARVRKWPDPRGHQTRFPFLREVPTQVGDSDVEMTDDMAPPRRQTIHLSGNSIFSSSDEFTIRSLRVATTNLGETSVARNRNGSTCSQRDPTRRDVVDVSQAGAFVAEYEVPLPVDSDHSSASTSATEPGVARKLFVGQQMVVLPGTSPARGESLVIRSRKPTVVKSSVSAQLFGLPGTSPARGESLIIRRNPATLTPPASPAPSAAPCPPSSPALDLAQELQSMDICGDMHSDGERNRSPISIPPQARSRSVGRNASAQPPTKKSVKRRPARNRAGTIRASDFAKPAGIASGSTAASASNVRRTRSGTVVGPDSKLAAKVTKLPPQVGKGTSTRLATVQSGSDAESDDELLLTGPWTEDVVHLGRKVPPRREEAEADEFNLGGSWHGLEFALQPSPRRPGLRR